MSMNAWTPEPWVVTDNEHVVRSTDGTLVGVTGTAGLATWDRATADAARIVACANGCAGINPEAVPDLLAALERCGTWMKLHPDDETHQRLLHDIWTAISKAHEVTS